MAPEPVPALALFGFTFLSMHATRNSHQFAPVVGAVTAWNFGEWAAAIRTRRRERGSAGSLLGELGRRGVAFGSCVACIVAVLSGAYYTAAEEDRAVGLGEKPLWFAHDAVKFAVGKGMPERGLLFHNGVASLYDYYGGPERKVYCDARLEVMGAKQFERYTMLAQAIWRNAPGWDEYITRGGRPVVIVDNLNEENTELSATFLNHPGWKCVWFDPMATVFLHQDGLSCSSGAAAAGRFSPLAITCGRATTAPETVDELIASSRGGCGLSPVASPTGPTAIPTRSGVRRHAWTRPLASSRKKSRHDLGTACREAGLIELSPGSAGS